MLRSWTQVFFRCKRNVDWLENILVPVHREGYRFIAAGLVLTLVFFYVWDPLGWPILLLTLGCAFFFRDPDRVTPTRAKLLIAPADGVVAQIGAAVPPEELDMGDDATTRIAIYISLKDVHIQRMPASGTVTRVVHRAGGFAASDPQAVGNEDNERQSVSLKTASGKDIAVVQIAGRFARRIVCTATEGQEVRAGERYGLIRFGSRVDVYLASGMRPQVVVGQRTLAGETVLVDERSREAQRKGEVR